jgi:hypothetical protein
MLVAGRRIIMINWNDNIAFGKKEEAKKDIILL